jgi:hypothetical protein
MYLNVIPSIYEIILRKKKKKVFMKLENKFMQSSLSCTQRSPNPINWGCLDALSFLLIKISLVWLTFIFYKFVIFLWFMSFVF